MPSTTQREMLAKVNSQIGFIAALDQSGGSTPKALALYGVGSDEYNTNEAMFGKVHEMRTRIITNSAFTGERVLGAILFETDPELTSEEISSIFRVASNPGIGRGSSTSQMRLKMIKYITPRKPANMEAMIPMNARFRVSI